MDEGEVGLQIAGWKIPSHLTVSWLAYQVSHCPWIVTLDKVQTQAFDLQVYCYFQVGIQHNAVILEI